MPAFILPFNKTSIKDIKIVGGKAASLGKLMYFGIPIPDGFIILTDAFKELRQELPAMSSRTRGVIHDAQGIIMEEII